MAKQPRRGRKNFKRRLEIICDLRYTFYMQSLIDIILRWLGHKELQPAEAGIDD